MERIYIWVHVSPGRHHTLCKSCARILLRSWKIWDAKKTSILYHRPTNIIPYQSVPSIHPSCGYLLSKRPAQPELWYPKSPNPTLAKKSIMNVRLAFLSIILFVFVNINTQVNALFTVSESMVAPQWPLRCAAAHYACVKLPPGTAKLGRRFYQSCVSFMPASIFVWCATECVLPNYKPNSPLQVQSLRRNCSIRAYEVLSSYLSRV